MVDVNSIEPAADVSRTATLYTNPLTRRADCQCSERAGSYENWSKKSEAVLVTVTH